MPHRSERNGKAVINITPAVERDITGQNHGALASPYYMARDNESGCYVNLAGRYDYLELPYYISQDYENAGRNIHPTCKEALDAYVTPLFLEKARLNGLPVPSYYITNHYFEPPVVLDSINPFMIRSRVVLKSGREETVARSLTRNYKYAVCCQEIPDGAQVKYFRAVLGWCVSRKYCRAAEGIWRVFRIPLARVRVIELNDGTILFSDLAQLPFEKLNRRESQHLSERIAWVE